MGAGHIFDIGSIIINPGGDSAVELFGQIVRVQAEKTDADSTKYVLIAFEFQELGQQKQQWLQHYLHSLP